MKTLIKDILLIFVITVISAGCSNGKATEQQQQITPSASETLAIASSESTESLPASATLGPLPTPIPNVLNLTIEENEIIGTMRLDPLSFKPVHGSQEAILARHANEQENGDPHNASISIDDNTTLEAVTIYTSAEEWVIQLMENDEVIFETALGDVSPVDPFRGLWLEDGHWVLEVAYVTNTTLDNAVYTQAVGQIIIDGVSLNDQYGYEETFGYQLLNGKPFFFCKVDGIIRLHYDGQVIPVWYNNVSHYSCCSGAVLNPKSGSNWVSFWGERDGIWYYTEIGQY